MDISNNKPACFGILEIVFSKTENDLRQSPENCIDCSLKTDCLKNALKSKNGISAKEEIVDRAYSFGTIGFLERWSKKKYLKKKIKKEA